MIIYKCDYCGMEFDDKDDYTEHMKFCNMSTENLQTIYVVIGNYYENKNQLVFSDRKYTNCILKNKTYYELECDEDSFTGFELNTVIEVEKCDRVIAYKPSTIPGGESDYKMLYYSLTPINEHEIITKFYEATVEYLEQKIKQFRDNKETLAYQLEGLKFNENHF
jgi:hypothetical protein